jgi:16S rRNA (uracil1498-N3)-methyltransferase
VDGVPDEACVKSRRASLEREALDAVLEGAALPEAAAHYLARVLRLKGGAEVELADGSGRVARGRLEREGDEWRLVGASVSEQRPDTVPIVLLAGLLKPKRWSLLVEKSVELGVARLVPVLTERAAVRPRPKEAGELVIRWSRQALEALKQCRRATATVVAPPRELAEALAELGGASGTNRLVGVADGGGGWPEEGVIAGAETVLFVGPEGGLSEQERGAVLCAGFLPVSLGAFTLRAETAALALVVMARDRLGFARQEREGEDGR